jgi:tetratricopeptide (TPR) repeat protein
MLVMAGPGIAEGKTVYGASLLDLTPTLLTLCGLPCGEDMPGKPLLEALSGISYKNLPRRIPSWESVSGECGLHGPEATYGASADDGAALNRQLVALGYVEDSKGNAQLAAESARIEAAYNLAQVYLATHQAERAVPLLAENLRRRPWESRFIHQLALSLVKSNRPGQCIELLQAAYPDIDNAPPPPILFLVLARAFHAKGRSEAAWRCAARAARALPMLSGASVELAEVCLELGKLEAAEFAAKRALALEATSGAAWQILAEVALRRHHWDRALEAGLNAVERLWQMGRAHLIIGLALAHLGRHEEARTALERAATMLPHSPHPWRVLAILPNSANLGDGFLREACRHQARRLSRAAAQMWQQRRTSDAAPLDLPPLPAPAERYAAALAARPPQNKHQILQLSPTALTLVSGLPRSGTSLMMQMLAAGGLQARTDGTRTADTDNPEGYFEWEAIKQLSQRPEILQEPGLERYAIKCVSAHLTKLPGNHRYRILFMMRPCEEVARSQQRMIQRRGTSGMAGSLQSISAALERHRTETLNYLKRHPRAFEVLEIDYPDLVAHPELWVPKIAEFLGPELLPEPEKMLGCVRPELHRNR